MTSRQHQRFALNEAKKAAKYLQDADNDQPCYCTEGAFCTCEAAKLHDVQAQLDALITDMEARTKPE